MRCTKIRLNNAWVVTGDGETRAAAETFTRGAEEGPAGGGRPADDVCVTG